MHEESVNVKPVAMTTEQFAKWANISVSKAYDIVSAREIRVKKLGVKNLITFEAAEEWLSNLPDLPDAA